MGGFDFAIIGPNLTSRLGPMKKTAESGIILGSGTLAFAFISVALYTGFSVDFTLLVYFTATWCGVSISGRVSTSAVRLDWWNYLYYLSVYCLLFSIAHLESSCIQGAATYRSSVDLSPQIQTSIMYKQDIVGRHLFKALTLNWIYNYFGN